MTFQFTQDLTSYCITIIAGILAIAYPIMTEVISKLDEKYSSINIVKLFSNEKIKKFFDYALYISIGSIILSLLNVPPFSGWEILDNLLAESNKPILLISSIALMILLIMLIRKILIYYTPIRFLEYLKKHYLHELKEETKWDLFVALTDLTVSSIKKRDHKLSTELCNFMISEFDLYRESFKGDKLIYRNEQISFINDVRLQLIESNNPRMVFFEYRINSNLIILGERNFAQINEHTRSLIWNSIRTSIEFSKDDFIQYTWEFCYQFYLSKFRKSTFQDGIIVNEKETFYDIFIALGGLLLYTQKYFLVKNLWSYTQSIPADYIFVPNNINQIFSLIRKFLDEYKYSWISTIFPFPNLKGINADYQIKDKICEYLVLLYLRLYIHNQKIFYKRATIFPNIPRTTAEKNQLLADVEFVIRKIKRLLKNDDLLKSFGLEFLIRWDSRWSYLAPVDYFDKFRRSLISNIESHGENCELSIEKYKKFHIQALSSISELISEISSINNESFVGEQKFYTSGISYLLDKAPFTDDDDGIDHLNYDSFPIERFLEEIKYGIADNFTLARTSRFVFEYKDLEKVIEKLSGKFIDLAIVSFGVDLDSENAIYFPWSGGAGNSLYFIERDDLPYLNFKEATEEAINSYDLLEINNTHIYTGIVDLNLNTGLREELINGNRDKNLRKMVYLSIYANLEVNWKGDIKCIEIVIKDPYFENGVTNRIHDLDNVK